MAGNEPAFVHYGSEDEYFRHYVREYCRKEIFASDGIRVYFRPSTFWHAFFQDDDSRFDYERAKRIDWIRFALSNPLAQHFVGHRRGGDVFARRVTVFHRFVVVLNLKSVKRGKLKAEFWTCYPASARTFEKISSNPWNAEKAIEELRSRQQRDREQRKNRRSRRS